MQKNLDGKITSDFRISEENNAAIEKAAARAALKKHRAAENPIAVWRDGKVVVLSGEE